MRHKRANDNPQSIIRQLYHGEPAMRASSEAGWDVPCVARRKTL